MQDPRYNVDYDAQLGLYRFQVAPGQRLLPAPPRIVALGGGTGLPTVLEGLKAAFFPRGWVWSEARDRSRLTAIVTVADDGGSSGRLRNAYHVLPMGDIRNWLLALSDVSPTMQALFNFRFPGNGEMDDHSLGNLILTALSLLEKDFPKAIERGGDLLRVRGRILPATTEDITLIAEFTDGTSMRGESRIASAGRPIRRILLEPEENRILPEAREALLSADIIVIGPGSLYTSLIPILLVKELVEAIACSTARIMLIMNLMSEPGETDHYTAIEHLLALHRHAPSVPIHDVLLNSTTIPDEIIGRYAERGARPIDMEVEPFFDLGIRVIKKDLLRAGPKIRHDPRKLARAILEVGADVDK